jgi:tetratricopeptide (TPR) repeat protein
LAVFDNRRGDLPKATEELVRAIELNEELGLTGYMGVLLARLGIVRTSAGDVDGARAANLRALELGRRLMDPPVLGMALGSMARLSLRLGALDEAEQAASEALEIYRSGAQGASGGRRNLALDVQAGTAMAYAVLGFVAQHNGDGAEADRLHRAGLGQAMLTRNPRAMAVAIEGLAGAAALLGEGVRAAHLLGHAARMRAESDTPAGDFEQHDLERVQNLAIALLGPDEFVEAFEQGDRSELNDLVG